MLSTANPVPLTDFYRLPTRPLLRRVEVGERLEIRRSLSLFQPSRCTKFPWTVIGKRRLLSKVLRAVPVKERLPLTNKPSGPRLVLVLSRYGAHCLFNVLCLGHRHDALFFQRLGSLPKVSDVVGFCHPRL
jgi:hypothetical protein